MDNKAKELPQSKIKYEFMVFLEFIEKSTGWEKGKTPYIFFSKSGIDGITREPTTIYIQSYGDSYFHNRMDDVDAKFKTALICLGEKCDDDFAFPNEFNYKKGIILDAEFIKRLAINNPELWWLFVSSCSEKCRIEIDKDGKNLFLKASRFPYIQKLINIETSLKVSNINELSRIFEEDFKYRNRNSKETYVIIGNGVSVPFGSDVWIQLSDYLFDYLKPQYIDNSELVKKTIGNSVFSTTSISKQLINPDKFDDALYSCIYRKYEDNMHTNSTLLRQISLSKMFNPNLKLVTYNYDEFLEIDFNKHCHPDFNIAPVCNAKEDKITKEPKICHVHGFISFDRKTKKGVVLTQEEYYKTYKNDNWVVKTQEDALNHNCIYVGSSMSDLFQMSIIDRVRESYYKDSSSYVFMQPWKCYALLCFKDLSARDIATIYCYYLNKGIRVIFTNDFNELPSKYADIISQ